MKALLAGIVICALFSLPSLNIRGIPSESFTWTLVEVEIPDLSAEYLNEAVLDPVADALIRIDGVKDLYCAVFNGGLLFQLSSDPGKDLLPDLERRLRRLRHRLPYQAGNPRIFTLPPAPSLVSFVFTLDNEHPEITAQNLRELREELISLKGVHSVDHPGIPDTELEIHLSPSKLVSARISPLQVKNTILESLFRMSAGVREGPYRRSDLVLRGGADTPEDLLNLPIPLQSRDTVSFCTLGDVAHIGWSAPLYGERIQYAEQQGGMVRIQFSQDSSLFERFRTVKEADRIISAKSFILEHKKLYSTSEGIIPSGVLLLFSILFSSILLFKIRPILQICAAPALVFTLHALFARTVEPNTLTAMGIALLIFSGILLYGHRSCRLLLIGLPVATIPVVTLPAGLLVSGSLPVNTILLQLIFSLLIEGGARIKNGSPRIPCSTSFMCTPGLIGPSRISPLKVFLPGAAILLAVQILLFGPTEDYRMYAVLSHPGLEIPVERERDVFIMDYPQGPPEVLAFPLEHWLARFDPDFFIIGGDQPLPPDLLGHGAWIIPLSSGYGARDLPDLFQSISSSPGIEPSEKRRIIEIDPDRTVGTDIPHRTILQHLQLALQGFEVGQIKGRYDTRLHTVRLRYGEDLSLSDMPVFSGNSPPVALREISRHFGRREKTIFLEERHNDR